MEEDVEDITSVLAQNEQASLESQFETIEFNQKTQRNDKKTTNPDGSETFNSERQNKEYQIRNKVTGELVWVRFLAGELYQLSPERQQDIFEKEQ